MKNNIDNFNEKLNYKPEVKYKGKEKKLLEYMSADDDELNNEEYEYYQELEELIKQGAITFNDVKKTIDKIKNLKKIDPHTIFSVIEKQLDKYMQNKKDEKPIEDKQKISEVILSQYTIKGEKEDE